MACTQCGHQKAASYTLTKSEIYPSWYVVVSPIHLVIYTALMTKNNVLCTCSREASAKVLSEQTRDSFKENSGHCALDELRRSYHYWFHSRVEGVGLASKVPPDRQIGYDEGTTYSNKVDMS